MSDHPTTLKGCLGQAKDAAVLAAAWAEATDLFVGNAAVARTFAAEAAKATRPALEATTIAATLAKQAQKRPPDEAVHAEREAQRVQEWADTAAQAATHAKQSAQAAQRFAPATGDLSDLLHTRQVAYYAWVTCSAPPGSVRLAVLRARVEEAQAAVQAALPVPALA